MALTKFLNEPLNYVTREKLFFNRLYFDLKLAAVRANYPLAIFEPEVDRDKFDVLLDDGDAERRVQLKTVLQSSSTTTWYSTKRFLRPDMVYGESLGIPPAHCGVGGGFILIEVNDTDEDAPVSYSYFDIWLAMALDMGLLVVPPASTGRRGPGKPPKQRRQFAREFLAQLHDGDARDDIAVPRQLFFKVKAADGLLALMGMHSREPCYLPANDIVEAHKTRFEADDAGLSVERRPIAAVAASHHHASEILDLLAEPNLQVFTRRVATTIACLGWGSLIWNPGSLELTGEWESDGPSLPVEFTRQSDNGRVTLVITQGARSIPVLWSRMATESIEEAITALAEREGMKGMSARENIGLWTVGRQSDQPEAAAIGDWATAMGLAGVVWTALGSRFEGAPRTPSSDEVVGYLGGLAGEQRSAAEEYIRRAPVQITTTYRRAIEQKLGWRGLPNPKK